LLGQNVCFALVLLFPYAYYRVQGIAVTSKQMTWFAVGLVAAIAVVVATASKAGAGPHHLLPFIVPALYLVTNSAAGKAGGSAAIVNRFDPLKLVFVLFLVGCVSCLANLGAQSARQIKAWREQSAKLSELSELIQANPEAEVGVGDTSTYSDSFFRPIQVWRNGQLHLDVGAWMDLKAAGVGEAAALKAISNCRVGAWILPAGTPFSAISFYDGKPMFSNAFQASFVASYHKVSESRHYSIWKCNGL
jgi:hypothetical protein